MIQKKAEQILEKNAVGIGLRTYVMNRDLRHDAGDDAILRGQYDSMHEGGVRGAKAGAKAGAIIGGLIGATSGAPTAIMGAGSGAIIGGDMGYLIGHMGRGVNDVRKGLKERRAGEAKKDVKITTKVAGIIDTAKDIGGGAMAARGVIGMAQSLTPTQDAEGRAINQRAHQRYNAMKRDGLKGGLIGAAAGAAKGALSGGNIIENAAKGGQMGYVAGAATGAARDHMSNRKRAALTLGLDDDYMDKVAVSGIVDGATKLLGPAAGAHGALEMASSFLPHTDVDGKPVNQDTHRAIRRAKRTGTRGAIAGAAIGALKGGPQGRLQSAARGAQLGYLAGAGIGGSGILERKKQQNPASNSMKAAGLLGI